jgi:hypothetical protein
MVAQCEDMVAKCEDMVAQCEDMVAAAQLKLWRLNDDALDVVGVQLKDVVAQLKMWWFSDNAAVQ